jgi:hypothetical protein
MVIILTQVFDDSIARFMGIFPESLFPIVKNYTAI